MAKTEKPLIEVFGQRPGRFKLALKGAEIAGINCRSKVLEVGCSYGDTSFLLAESFDCEVTGIDLEREYIVQAAARTDHTDHKVQFCVADVVKMPFMDQAFDYIFCEAAYSLLKDKEAAVDEYHRVLGEKGKVIVNDFYLKRQVSENVQKKMDFIPCFYGIKTAEEYCKIFSEKGFSQLLFADYSSEIIRISMWLSKAYGVSSKELNRLFVKLLSQNDDDHCDCLNDSNEFFKEARLGYGQFIFGK